MKILFLDFDGVLNSKQEVLWHHRLNKRRKRAFKTFLHEVIYKIRVLIGKVFPSMRSDMTLLSLYYLTDHCEFDPIACSNVQVLLDEIPELQIVISSTWRSWGLVWLKKILQRNGIDPDRVIDITGREAGERGIQCKAWLDRAIVEGMAIDGFVAVDDDTDFTCMKDNFVRTDSHVGFTIRDAYKVAKVLGLKMLRNHTLFDDPKGIM